MKYFTILGGLLGFVLTFALSLSAGTESGLALRDAAFGCLAAAALFRGFRHVMLHHVRCLLAEKARQRQAASSSAI